MRFWILSSSVFGIKDGKSPFAIPERDAGIGGSYLIIPKSAETSSPSFHVKLDWPLLLQISLAVFKEMRSPWEICPLS